MAKILLVEDDDLTSEVVAQALELDEHVVDQVSDGAVALQKLRSQDYDLIILDVGLPNVTGLEICHQYRVFGGKAPIVMLTGKDTVIEKIAGLDSGAELFAPRSSDHRNTRTQVVSNHFAKSLL